MALGVLLSGLGGLTVLNAVTRRLPDLPLVYFDDISNTPYRTRTADDITDLRSCSVCSK